MKNLYENTKQLILTNYNGELNENVLDILTVAIMALFIRFPETTKQRIPYILNKIEIFFENKTILEMVTNKYPNYPTNDITTTTNAFVLRALGEKDDKSIDEEWTMYISTSDINNSIVNLIAKTIHELLHLLRFNGIIDGEKEVKIKDGISIARYNKETETIKRKYYYLEEAIVETFKIQVMESLYEFIKNEDVSFNQALNTYKKKFEKEHESSYQIERYFLEGLCKDKQFSELVEYSFVDPNQTPSLITYYNNVMSNPTAFTTLSRDLEIAVAYAEKQDINNFTNKSQQLISTINSFLAKAHKRKRKS